MIIMEGRRAVTPRYSARSRTLLPILITLIW